MRKEDNKSNRTAQNQTTSASAPDSSRAGFSGVAFLCFFAPEEEDDEAAPSSSLRLPLPPPPSISSSSPRAGVPFKNACAHKGNHNTRIEQLNEPAQQRAAS